MKSASQIRISSAYQVSASLSVPSLQRAIARRVRREPGGRSSKRTTSVTIGRGLEALIEASPSVSTAGRSARAWDLLGRVWVVLRSGSVVFGCAHRLVAGEQGLERVDGGVAEFRGGEQVVRARPLSGLAALDVAPDERGDCKVLLGELGLVGGVGVTLVVHRSCSCSSVSRQHGPAAGIRSQVWACWR